MAKERKNEYILGFKPDIAIPPGETIKETLAYFGMTQTELAARMGRPIKTINEIIKGKAMITPETAIQLERVLRISADYILRLEQFYRETLARLKEEKQIKEEIIYLPNIPYNELMKRGCLKDTRDKIERVKESLAFYGVQSFEFLPTVHNASFRITTKKKFDPYAMAAWLRIGELFAQKVKTESFRKAKLKQCLLKIRSLTLQKPDKFNPKILELGKKCGIVFAFNPRFDKTYVNGATKWIKKDKALIQLSLKGKYNDIFWFTLFHEIGHILLHGKKETFIDYKNKKKDKEEIEADNFARNILIPKKEYEEFINNCNFSILRILRSKIISFASQIKIHPGIVVGRLQYDGLIPHSHYNEYKIKFEWKDD